MKYSGDGPGPFAGRVNGRILRILVDLPEAQRQPDASFAGPGLLGVPSPARFLWSLGLRDDIDVFWMARPGEPDGIGSVQLQDPDRAEDQLPFVVHEKHGSSLQAVSPYTDWETVAARSLPGTGAERNDWLHDVIVTRVAVGLRVDVLVTASAAVLASDERFVTEANPLPVDQALAVVGLYLRIRGEHPVVAPRILAFGEHLMLWSAVRSQLPSGWRWGSALVAHGGVEGRDGPTLLFGSLHERLVRVLRYRDQLHGALLVPQTRSTGDRATEALDNLMVNLVGAFDVAARVAHLVAGLPAKHRHRAKWQTSEWLKNVSDVAGPLAQVFASGADPAALFKICRILRNTVHGEALQSTTTQISGQERHTLVALPEDDAQDLADLFDRLGGRAEWGLRPTTGARMHVEPLPLVERLLPDALAILDDALRLTPVDRLPGIDPGLLSAGPPDDLHFGPGTRVRLCLLLGLAVPPNLI